MAFPGQADEPRKRFAAYPQRVYARFLLLLELIDEFLRSWPVGRSPDRKISHGEKLSFLSIPDPAITPRSRPERRGHGLFQKANNKNAPLGPLIVVNQSDAACKAGAAFDPRNSSTMKSQPVGISHSLRKPWHEATKSEPSQSSSAPSPRIDSSGA